MNTCNKCSIEKPLDQMLKDCNVCKDCNNLRRRTKYHTDENRRQKAIQQATEFKQKKAFERKQIKDAEQLAIGLDNKVCKYCSTVKNKDCFRHNRLKCKDCERDEPVSKLVRGIRSRILGAIRIKTKHTVEYLGCKCNDYIKWLASYDERYTFENRGTEWHIDHVIPLSKFNIFDEQEQLIAFNWRNTMPLSAKENLQKNNKIIHSQIESHLEHLKKYHEENNLDLPQEYIDLFAKHLDAGSPLEPN